MLDLPLRLEPGAAKRRGGERREQVMQSTRLRLPIDGFSALRERAATLEEHRYGGRHGRNREHARDGKRGPRWFVEAGQGSKFAVSAKACMHDLSSHLTHPFRLTSSCCAACDANLRRGSHAFASSVMRETRSSSQRTRQRQMRSSTRRLVARSRFRACATLTKSSSSSRTLGDGRKRAPLTRVGAAAWRLWID
jgi:hypothetical protein